MLPADRYDVAAAHDPWLGAVLLHPHPSYGGDRHNVVVDALFRALPDAGVVALRFDFVSDDIDRGATDAAAAIELLPPRRPIVVCGYSFGALVAAHVMDERVVGWALVAPPFGSMLRAETAPIGPDLRPKLVLAAEHDQFCPADTARRETEGWKETEVEAVTGADHFLAGATARVADRVATWLSRFRPAAP